MNVRPGDIVLVPMKITNMYLANEMADEMQYKLKPVVGKLDTSRLTLIEEELAECKPKASETTVTLSGDTDNPGVFVNVGGGDFMPEFDKPLHEPECCKNCPNRNNQFCNCALPYMSTTTQCTIHTSTTIS